MLIILGKYRSDGNTTTSFITTWRSMLSTRSGSRCTVKVSRWRAALS